MIDIEKDNLDKLKMLIEKNNEQLVDLLREILHIDIKEIKFDKQLGLSNISEYEFEVLKVRAVLSDDEEIEMYLKLIKNSKIKESIFCYWCLVYEEELLNKKPDQEANSFLNKVLISELTKKKYYQSVFLEIENNKDKILEAGTEVDFIEINNYINGQGKEEEFKNMIKTLEGLEEYVLLTGIKTNRYKEKDAL